MAQRALSLVVFATPCCLYIQPSLRADGPTVCSALSDFPDLPPASAALAQHALHAFEQVVGSTSGFRRRPGQHQMAETVAATLAQADLGEHPNPTKAIAVIQAGTGVGKSAAYASTAIAMALERKTRVIISTATVALQEQLMTKDLPALARSMDQPFAYALAKGRGRYVCKVKLERLVGSGAAEDDMFDDDRPQPKVSALSQEAIEERRQSAVREHGPQAGRGELGRRPRHPARHARPARLVGRGRRAPHLHRAPLPALQGLQLLQRAHQAGRGQCHRGQPRPGAGQSLGMKTLPDLDNCLVVFDEGHHLPAVALDQFSNAMDMSNLRWLDKLPKTMNEVSRQAGSCTWAKTCKP